MPKLKCTGCKQRFDRDSMVKLPAGNFHSIDCATQYSQASVQRSRAKQLAKTKRDDKKSHTQAKKRIKDNDRSFQINKTQTIFNKWVRCRDINLPCISCNRLDSEILYSGIGGKWDCGHYKTRGAYPELRFEPLNAHKQCKKCNGGSGKYSRKGRSVKEGYDIGLLAKIGQEAFDWVNGPHELKRYTIDDLRLIQAEYKAKTKEIEDEHISS